VIRAYPVHHNLPGRREVLSWPGAPPAGLGTPRGRTENSTPCKADRTPCTSAGLLAGCCPGSSWRYTAGRYARHSKPLPFLSHLRTISREDGGSDSGGCPDRRCEPSGVRMDSARLSPSPASCDPWTGPARGLAGPSRSGRGLSTGTARQLQVSYRYLTIGMSRQVTAILPESESPSDRDLSRQVTVDNFGYPLDLSTTRSAATPEVGATAAK